MSNILDRVMNDVCLDERISDGIFKMDESAHMDALRDYFIKRGITREAAVHVTNRMVEGKYPERQAFNRDGILVTFPTPQYKSRAIARGTHFEKNPVPQVQQQRDAAKQEEPLQAPPGSNPEPGELPPEDNDDDEQDKDTDNNDDDEGSGHGRSHGGSHGGGGSSGGGGSVFQGDTKLEIEPPRGQEQPDAPPQAPAPTVSPAPRTPQRVAAEKEISRQILSTDDTTLSNIGGPIGVNEQMQYQLRELYKRADEWGFYEAIKFLTPHVKS